MKHYLIPIYRVGKHEHSSHGIRDIIEVKETILPITTRIDAVPLVLKFFNDLVLTKVKLTLEIVYADY
jgi:hypothetical protein